MSFETLKTRILSEAKLKAEAVLAELERQRAAHEKRITDKASAMEETIIRDAESAAEQQERKLMQEAGLTSRAHVLNAKQKELEALEESVVEHILNQDASDLVSQLFSLIPEDEKGTVIAGEKHQAEVETIAKKRGLTVAKKTIKDDGGFIYQSDATELNMTVRALVHQLVSRHRVELARILFS